MAILTEKLTDVCRTREDDERWRRVLYRDTRSDGIFVYAVRSTGIYCRPSCPSRRPKRENVVFFELPSTAEHAGFRPCLRCRPRETAIQDPQLEIVRLVCCHIQTSDEPLTLAALGERFGWNPYHLQRTFKRLTGITPRQYAEVCRVKRLQARLRQGESVTEALYEVGYGSSSRLYESAPAFLGMTPAVYGRGGRGVKILYALIASPLGRLLVAATSIGVCAVSFGDDDAILEANLIREYPNAELQRDEAALVAEVNAILEHLNDGTPELNLPLDVQATAFQWRVWEALRAIPYGCTCSYKEIAETIGNPKAVRAVARACATNPVALVVPCHRVVRSDGDIGGYRWGVERKQTLLKRELEQTGSSFLKQSDLVLAKLIERVGDCQLHLVQQSGDTFNSLARAIIYQQLSTKAAAAIYNRFCLLYADKPAIEALAILNTPIDVLRGVGISRPKISYLKDLAAKTLAGLPTIAELEAMDNESIIKTLTQIKGIGRWTVQMLLIFRLHRLDVLPVDDNGVRTAIRQLYALERLPSRQMVEDYGQKWQPYAAIACWYLWRSLDMS